MGMETIALASAIIGGVSTVSSYMQGQKQASAQEAAQQQAKSAAMKQEKAADEASNRANMKTADTSAILSAAQQAGKGGASGTMLTGAQGIDPAALQLGKNTLLGG
jgi:mannitol-specific phosphotransferase system IIBC component